LSAATGTEAIAKPIRKNEAAATTVDVNGVFQLTDIKSKTIATKGSVKPSHHGEIKTNDKAIVMPPETAKTFRLERETSGGVIYSVSRSEFNLGAY